MRTPVVLLIDTMLATVDTSTLYDSGKPCGSVATTGGRSGPGVPSFTSNAKVCMGCRRGVGHRVSSMIRQANNRHMPDRLR
jgi:hypothetical protein